MHQSQNGRVREKGKKKNFRKSHKWTIVWTKRSFVLRSFDAVTFFPAKCQDHSNDYNARVGYAFFSLFCKMIGKLCKCRHRLFTFYKHLPFLLMHLSVKGNCLLLPSLICKNDVGRVLITSSLFGYVRSLLLLILVLSP